MGQTFSLGQLVIDDEIAAMIKRVVSGVSFDDELMGVDLIKKVGIAGDFFSRQNTLEHTMKHMATEQVQSTIIDRRAREGWEKEGSKSMLQRANEKVVEILKNHKPCPLPEGVGEELKRIIRSAE